MEKPQLALSLPAPRRLTASEMAAATTESRKIHERLRLALSSMERFSADDLAVVIF